MEDSKEFDGRSWIDTYNRRLKNGNTVKSELFRRRFISPYRMSSKTSEGGPYVKYWRPCMFRKRTEVSVVCQNTNPGNLWGSLGRSPEQEEMEFASCGTSLNALHTRLCVLHADAVAHTIDATANGRYSAAWTRARLRMLKLSAVRELDLLIS